MMGQSTDAILFYGYCWHNEERLTEDRWETNKESKEEFGVEIGSHCSIDYSVPYVFISESETTAWRGSPQLIDATTVRQDTAEWDKRLADFIAKYDIDLSEPEYGDAPSGPGWFLASYVG